MSEHSQKELTPKEEAFIQFYCSNGFNGTKAAISAGYGEDRARQTAHDIVTKRYISERIEAYKKEQANKNDVTIKEVIDNARYIIEQSKEKKELNNMAKGNEQLGKTIGAFVDKTDINTKIDFNITDEDEKEI